MGLTHVIQITVVWCVLKINYGGAWITTYIRPHNDKERSLNLHVE